jgi:hypothetical protein
MPPGQHKKVYLEAGLLSPSITRRLIEDFAARTD